MNIIDVLQLLKFYNKNKESLSKNYEMLSSIEEKLSKVKREGDQFFYGDDDEEGEFDGLSTIGGDDMDGDPADQWLRQHDPDHPENRKDSEESEDEDREAEEYDDGFPRRGKNKDDTATKRRTPVQQSTAEERAQFEQKKQAKEKQELSQEKASSDLNVDDAGVPSLDLSGTEAPSIDLSDIQDQMGNDNSTYTPEGYEDIVNPPKEESQVPKKDKVRNKNNTSDDGKVPLHYNKRYMKEWQPNYDRYKEHHHDEIKEHMDGGYTHREAERLANAHKAYINQDRMIQDAVAPSMPSDRMLSEIKGHARQYLHTLSRRERLDADSTKNPRKHAQGKMIEAHEGYTKDFDQAYKNYTSSKEYSGLSAREKHKARKQFISDYKEKNPEYSTGIQKFHEGGNHQAQSEENIHQNLFDQVQHMLTSGHNPDAVSMAEATQHVGGIHNDDGGSSIEGVSFKQDNSSTFAHNNPDLMSKLSGEQQSRLNRLKAMKMNKPKDGGENA